MFTKPIKHTRLKTMEELLKFSVKTNYCSGQTRAFGIMGEQFAFSDDHGYLYVTPYRSEITDILMNAGYKSGNTMFPGTDISEGSAYDWLKSIADEENWAETYETAFKIASEKGIKSVEVNTDNLRIKNIVYWYDDYAAQKKYGGMITQFLTYDTENNIATYILINEKTVLICDEYGRTFLVKSKTVINDFVNAMIEAGYTRTVHPEKYVRALKSE